MMICSGFVTFTALLYFTSVCANGQEIIGCGGFIKSEVEINFSVIDVKLYTKQGSLKYETDCAPNNGYYMVPVYDKGDYVLKVEPPPGWTFEPSSVDIVIDGKTDKCSLGEDINFQFTGFGVVGKVVSRGESTGPAGVILTLKKAAGLEQVQQTTSVAGGDFVFEKVLPGEYLIEASKEPWLFDVGHTTVKVDRETGNAGSVITVSGYNVQGRVSSDGEPVQGVQFLLFTPKKTGLPHPSGCNIGSVNDAPILKDMTYLCHIISASDGTFVFPSVPTGKYSIAPFYKGESIKFDVVPNQLDITVEHSSVIIKELFRVAGFSVSGYVRTKDKGPGIVGARVILNSKLQAITQDEGVYHLDSMKSGTYRLQIEAPRMSFDIVDVKITPNTPRLPDVTASGFEVCGSVEMEPIAIQSRNIRVVDSAGKHYRTVVAGVDGSFCVDCKPGTYHFSVELNEADAKVGLKLAPSSKEVTVVDSPVDGIRFFQYRAKISGSVHCLESSCGQLNIVLQSVTRPEDQRTVEGRNVGQDSSFQFTDVVPGKYRVSVLNEQWCWKAKSLEIEVIDKDLTDIVFIQSGFMLSASLSHSVTLNFSLESMPAIVGSFDLTKGVNKFCLAQPGVYRLIPVSCHKFEQEVYSYDTSIPTILSLVATHHLVEGVITTDQLLTDILMVISSGDSKNEIGPLTADGVVELEPKSNATEAKQLPEPPYTYRFSYWAKNGEKLTFTPVSTVLLFHPPTIELTVTAGKCLGVVASFEGQLGIFIEGMVTPALEGVEITVTTADGTVIAELLTNEAGQYRVGPLDSSNEYQVTAVKEGFVFSAIDGKPIGHFKSFELGRIHVEVADSAQLPLASVLLSLSGTGNYRRNNVTQEGGFLDFTSLSPGEYYLRVMMKEYQFEPASQLIHVSEGDTVNIKVIGQRVEFSCYGTVSSLSGEAEAAVFVEAVTVVEASAKTCRPLQEDTKTELDGSFRIRGLQPGCHYIIRLKAGDMNSLIERSIPRFKRIQMDNGDVTGVNIIAFRRISHMDISGNIVGNSSLDHINTLKVLLFKDSSQDSPVHSASLGPTSFFYLPPIPINNQSYILKLTSSLSHVAYDYSVHEVQFAANIPHRHFTFKFEPQRKLIDQDQTHGSFMVLPIALIILFLGYNYQKVLPWLSDYASSLQNLQSMFSQSSSQSVAQRQAATSNSGDISQITELLASDAAKKKPKARKIN